MSIEFRQLHPVFAAEVSGVDISRPLDPAEAKALDAAINRYAVLVFRGQAISDQQQIAFTLNFGELERPEGGHITKPEDRRLDPRMNDVSNLDQSHRPMARDDRRHMFNLGNRLWHSDSSYRVIPAKYSLLSARRIPPTGGNTEFADMRAAYDALDDATKAEIEDLVCEHSLIYSRGLLGFADFTPEEQAMFRPVLQRLVRTHPLTGRKSLYLASHAGTIVGWPMPEARALLRDLTEHATQSEFVHVHRWQPDDLVMWDNRQTMHRARRFDERLVRDVRRTTVAGESPTIAQ
jgi:alpha-ketoglutarate-dependent 2,4-dichlorophenoxyacetate dioxygenase